MEEKEFSFATKIAKIRKIKNNNEEEFDEDFDEGNEQEKEEIH
jgi:hypothetical protein